LNINFFVTFVKPFIFTGIQRLKTGLFYKRNSVIFIDGCMGVGGIFPEGGQWWIFSGVATKNFIREAKSDEVSFYPLETQKKIFFAKNLILKMSKFLVQVGPSKAPWA